MIGFRKTSISLGSLSINNSYIITKNEGAQMNDDKINELIVSQLHKYSNILEKHFHDIVDIEFVLENGELFILSSKPRKCSRIANVKVAMDMFCEGIITPFEVIKKIPYNDLAYLIDEMHLVDSNSLCKITSGIPAGIGSTAGISCSSYEEALNLIEQREPFIYCVFELAPHDIDIVVSTFCRGVITFRGGISSHAAVVCRALELPCVTNITDRDILEETISNHKALTIDGTDGTVYSGIGQFHKNNIYRPEIQMLYKLLRLMIKNNIVNNEITPHLWRLWDVFLGNRYNHSMTKKQFVERSSHKNISFQHPSQEEISKICTELTCVQDSHILIEDLIKYLINALSSKVPLGSHHLYLKPLLDPMKTISTDSFVNKDCKYSVYTQLTGIEFHHINRYIDYLIDIYSIKIYFSSSIEIEDEADEKALISHLNFLDYTNPKGESIIINTYHADRLAIYINNVLVSQRDLTTIYHLLRRRQYHFNWYKENNTSSREIRAYLESQNLASNLHLYGLCQQLHFVDNFRITKLGISYIGGQYEQ
jgi:phosphohistidine swiveling domain-containing protein